MILAEHAISSGAHVEYYIISVLFVNVSECQLTVKHIMELRFDLLNKSMRFVFLVSIKQYVVADISGDDPDHLLENALLLLTLVQVRFREIE